MCLAVPLKIIDLKDFEAIGEMGGVKRKIRTDLIKDLKLGDYVLVHAGFAIEKLKEKQAKETLEAIDELEEALRDDKK
ncbi:MAG: HypC/HybG/HupF family hydrogenase formation chaperone [Clostridiaceae bacterium]